jgi:hypothetical protein
MRVKRSVANTAAASVEETTAPSSTDCSQDRSNRAYAASPVRRALTTTPTVASSVAGTATSRSRRHEVASPPSKRIAASATTPTFRARSASSNSIPPRPSEPSSIPRPRNATSDGTPALAAPNATTMLAARTPPTIRSRRPSSTYLYLPASGQGLCPSTTAAPARSAASPPPRAHRLATLPAPRARAAPLRARRPRHR